MKKTEFLTSRERVIRTIEHKSTDRYPIDLGMHFSSGISAFAYYNLRKYLGLSADSVEIADTVQILARVDTDILEAFHCDTLLLRPKWEKTVKWSPKPGFDFVIPQKMNPLLDENGCWHVRDGDMAMSMPPGSCFFDGDWLQVNELDADEYIRQTAKEAERIHKETDYFTSFLSLNAYFEGMDFACDMYTDPESIIERNKSLHAENMRLVTDLIKHAGEYIDGIVLAGDLGTQNGPICAPELYEELCAPFLKELCSLIHDCSAMKIQLHSCGSIDPFIPCIIDSGVDVLNPVQISADGMDPQTLKNKYGDKICFWGGGCNTQHVLPVKPPDEVRKNVRELTDIFKVNGGFVFNAVHNIMGEVPPENIAAMYEAAYENSFYENFGSKV